MAAFSFWFWTQDLLGYLESDKTLSYISIYNTYDNQQFDNEQEKS